MGKSLTRRNFVKAAAAVAAGTASACALTSCQPSGTSNLEVDENVAANPADLGEEFYCTCSWSCSFCQYRIFTRNGNVSHMLPKPDFDYRTCLKGRSRIQRAYSDARIQYPMRRVDGTPRGGGEWSASRGKRR